MDYKKEFQEIVKSLKANALLAGNKLRNEDIAGRLGYNSDYFNTLNGKSGKVTEDHLNTLKMAFKDELNGVVKPSLPGNELNRERALIKMLYHRVAKLEAERLGVPVELVIKEMEQDTMIAWKDLEKEG